MGEGALEQVETLTRHGVAPERIVLSHTDRKPDFGYHHEILSTGARVEYDSGFRWKGEENPTLDLLERFLPEFPEQIMLGMDAARPAYWISYGGGPGLDFLLTTFTGMMRERGISDELWQRIFLTNPVQAYDRNPTKS